MSWINRTRVLTALAGGLLAAGSAQAGILVVRSNGPSAGAFPPGKSLDGAGTITLKQGDVITILDTTGTRVLRGPGKVAVAGGNAASASGIRALIADTGLRQTRTGATRGASDAPPRPTNVWFVDASRGGTVCVVNPANVTLWRPDYAAQGSLRLTRLADGKSSNVDFGVGQSVRPWPADVPVVDGASYRLDGAGLSAPATIRLKLLAAAPASLDAAAQALIAKSCDIQLDLLVQSTADDPDN